MAIISGERRQLESHAACLLESNILDKSSDKDCVCTPQLIQDFIMELWNYW